MMPEISLNILDVAHNSIKAQASRIDITIDIQTQEDRMTITILDDGYGMSDDQVTQVVDPFYTTRTTRDVGLGVPFFQEAAEMTGGTFTIGSELGVGTEVKACFVISSIDRMPLGDITETMHSLIVFNEGIRFYYRYRYDELEFVLDTEELREILGHEISFQKYEVSEFIREYLSSNKQHVDMGKYI